MNKVNDSLKERNFAQAKSDVWFYGIIAVVIAVLTLFMVVHTIVRVDGQSMKPTLKTDDVLVASKILAPKKGEIIVVKDEQQDWIIKRVIATEGDKVEFKDDGFVYVNGTLYEDEFGHADFSQRVSVPFNEKVLEKN